MYLYSTSLTPTQILERILNISNAKEKRYIITGKPGITGKTWLTNQLLNKGYDAIEISELIYDAVEYKHRGNLVIDQNNIVLIVLNMQVEVE